MIFFKRVLFKNFLSVGNAPIEIDLSSSKKVLITGKNGNGKSTILSAITFALFNRPIKSLNKGGLVNSINNKNCLVEIEFSIGPKEYKVRRGIKPNIFEIYENGKLIDQPGVLDYQEFLENKILQCNFRAFTQTTVISIENYVPFMKLRSHERREFIEELLDIKVFSTMNTLLKGHINEVKDELKFIDTKLKLTKEKAILQKKHIDQLESIRDEQTKAINEKITKCAFDIKVLNETIDRGKLVQDALVKDIEELEEQQKEFSKYFSAKDKLIQKIDTLIEQCDFYENTESCPTCKQSIEQHHKEVMLTDNQKAQSKYKEALSSIEEELKKHAEISENLLNANQSYRKIVSDLQAKSSSIKQLEQLIAEYTTEVHKAQHNNESLDEQKSLLKTIASEALQLSTQRSELNEKSQYYDIAYQLLKDTGIKAKIIKQYVPVINKYVNKYLAEMDFFVSFELDENFNETIKSRHRDTFTYFNFSAGEAQRIDLAMMLTWRQIAKMKNSFNSNILFLDEVLDRVDAIGFDLLINIFSSVEMNNTNIFVVSHKPKDTLVEIFDTTIEMAKDKHGFSEAIYG